MGAAQGRPFAVVTGASSGIGFELAKIFHEEGFDLLIAADDSELAQAREALNGSRPATVETHRVDLAGGEGVAELYDYIAATGRPVDALALTAEVQVGGAFATETELFDELQLIDLNVRSNVHLCKFVLADMVDRGEGRVLFTSSIAPEMSGDSSAVYNASKSFVQSFAMALREELEGSGVTITSLIPDPTETESFERAGMEDAEVARQGFDALMDGREKVVAAT